MNYLKYPSPVGALNILSRDGKIVGIMPDKCALRTLTEAGPARYAPDDPVLCLTAGWLDRYFAAGVSRQNEALNASGCDTKVAPPSPDALPLAPVGNRFCLTVWEMLRSIPYGECVTYGALAREYCRITGEAAMSAQAIGGALKRNPIMIVIPCHRVIGANGSLTGYAGGVEMKRALLRLEGAI